jgi:hypothetical protein
MLKWHIYSVSSKINCPKCSLSNGIQKVKNFCVFLHRLSQLFLRFFTFRQSQSEQCLSFRENVRKCGNGAEK